jgi:hypothetical protein
VVYLVTPETNPDCLCVELRQGNGKGQDGRDSDPSKGQIFLSPLNGAMSIDFCIFLQCVTDVVFFFFSKIVLRAIHHYVKFVLSLMFIGVLLAAW